MKTPVFLLLIATMLLSTSLEAQRASGVRIGYIDMDYILENVPEYQEASTQLDDKVGKWKGEIETRLEEVAAMKKQLDNERALLTKELIEERDEEITFERDQILEYQQKRFGPGGDLAIQRRQLVEPVQDQVFNAVQEISAAKKFDLVFDKSSDLMMLYTADRLNISDQVLRSITRAAKRNQINSKKDEKDFDIDEAKTVEQDKASQERQRAINAKTAERDAALEARNKDRETQKAERQAAFQERRRLLLEERQRKKDSIQAVREARTTTPSGRGTPTLGTDPANAKAAKEAAIADRKRKKDSIIAVRKAKRDSILEARKKKTTPPAQNGNDGDGR
ncbi:OmpH family outer membrane protein [Dokdonia sp. 4H-3-7-5]|uniref:OmpH family outer membrane protein n=1 Tax=Dokdonia sp. (strain 4H-3-7-5) TaxID=983548 RepID=UPI00020A7C29|nr:OmpH family outer membrane protein [Dokdonia sp. 4H-3-7-5]AEE18820.1 outer membrane chaperone Skp (OmpH) [Dokdonia sp. 4H-3-7-5]